MKKLLIAVLIGFGIYGYVKNSSNFNTSTSKERLHSDQAIADAYQQQLRGLQVSGSGEVSRILSDDNKGSRHQRFILRLSSGQTLLVAHNIDLALRVDNLKKGDMVHYFGEYEWNPKGGVIHWTHRDPGGRHVGGWLKHNGRTYE